MRPDEGAGDFDTLLRWDLSVHTSTNRYLIKGGTGVIGETRGQRFLRGTVQDSGDRLFALDSLVAIWPQVKSIVTYRDGKAQFCSTGETGFSLADGRVSGILIAGYANRPTDEPAEVTLIDPKEGEKERLRTLIGYGLVSGAVVGFVLAFQYIHPWVIGH